MVVVMSAGLRIVVASYGADQFRLLHEILTSAGHVPVSYLFSRSMRPATDPEPDILESVTGIIASLPPGMDLLLPGTPGAVGGMLARNRPDVLLVFGFNWRLPKGAPWEQGFPGIGHRDYVPAQDAVHCLSAVRLAAPRPG